MISAGRFGNSTVVYMTDLWHSYAVIIHCMAVTGEISQIVLARVSAKQGLGYMNY